MVGLPKVCNFMGKFINLGSQCNKFSSKCKAFRLQIQPTCFGKYKFFPRYNQMYFNMSKYACKTLG